MLEEKARNPLRRENLTAIAWNGKPICRRSQLEGCADLPAVGTGQQPCRWPTRGAGVLAAAIALTVGLPASAAVVTFDFNLIPLAAQSGGNSTNKLNPSAGSSTIGTWMTTKFGSTVTVLGGLATGTYDGESRIVAPELTLGTSDYATSPTDAAHGHSGAKDTFIVNDNFGIGGASTSDFIQFSFAGISITQVEFDWEIFPDVNCSPSCSTTGSSWPDFELWAGTLSPTTQIDLTPSLSGLSFLASYSPASNPRDLGHTAVTLNNAAVLKFMDWPAEIGIDNLKITYSCTAPTAGCGPVQQSVPEPASLALLGLGLAGLAASRRRKQ
jgi:hypothetical protein